MRLYAKFEARLAASSVPLPLISSRPKAPNSDCAEHAHAVRPPSAREIVAILALCYAARLGGG
jgi:hypothetical protein